MGANSITKQLIASRTHLAMLLTDHGGSMRTVSSEYVLMTTTVHI